MTPAPPKPPSPPAAEDRLAAALTHEAEERLAEAETLLREALSDPRQAEAATVALGRVLCRQGRHAEAARRFEAALAEHGDRASLWLGLAHTRYLAGHLDDALAGYHRAAVLAPCDPSIPAAMANVHHRQGRTTAAADALAAAIALGASAPGLYHNLGHALVKLGRKEEALQVFEAAVARFADRADLWISLGNLRFERGAVDEAVAALRRSVELAPDDLYALKNLARKLHKAWRLEEAATVYRRVVDRDPQDSGAAHTLAALSGRATAAAPRDYVRDGFDMYADRFDAHLVDDLAYATPALLRAQLLPQGGRPPVFDRAVDLGCGTGLSGAPFRDLCRHLTGVDLSPRMLDEARKKGIYDRLCEAEIIEFLDGSPKAFDLVVAADVLVYIGDLAPVFAAVARRTRPGARFVFSTERAESPDRYVITPTGRYAHGRGYLEDLARRHDFTVVGIQRADLRKDRGRWVEGYLCVLGRPAAGDRP